MAEDWDLSAVVRGCRSSSSAAAAAATTTTITAPSSSSSSKEVSSPLIRQENDVFSFPSLIEPTTNGFRELHQLFKPFIPTTTTTIISTSGCGIYPNSSFTDFAVAGSSSNHNNNNNNNNINTTSSSSSLVASVSVSSSYASNISRPPHFMPQASPSTSSSSGFQRFHDQHVQKLQQQKQIQDQLQQLVHHQKQQFQTPPGQISGGGDVNNNSGMTLPNTQAPQATTRSRKRKSQQKRMVCHVTAENLTADSWAWRKYGQKPIKGSPYPRNYYRCSSSKGCGARKQVERSNTEPDMFIVTYTGEHTHPRPTHRNSLAGSTRNKPSAAAIRQPLSHEPGSPSNTANNRASSSSQLSPTTPLTAVATNDECADELMLSNEATSPFPDEDELDLASHDDILIPNMAAMMDKFLLGAGELHGIGLSGGGGGGNNTSGNPADGSYTNTEPGLTPNLQQHFSRLSRSSPG